jgi:signal transduction histidine kinase
MNMTDTVTRCLPDEELLALSSSVSMFAGIEPEAIMQFLRETSVHRLKRGDMLIENGTPARAAYLVVEGEIEVTAINGDIPVLVGVRQRGDLVGEMALLTNSRRNASLRARTDACLLAIESDLLNSWLLEQPSATLNILKVSVSRTKSAETGMIQHQHLAALGTLAAGLAHELNNPASALLRSSAMLTTAVKGWEQASWDLQAAGRANGLDRSIERLREVFLESSPPADRPDSITRSDRELAIQQWLAGLGIDAPWELAPVLVDRGWTLESLREAVQNIPVESLAASLRWLTEGGRVQDLLNDLRISAQVIGDLVAAVKSYSRLDEAPVQLVDLHDGIEQSLTILRYRLRGINVVRRYADNLPRITAYATELNQLWTNLMDNAATAMEGNGTLTITTRLEGDSIIVDVEDTGHGIPEDVQPHLFEPFFTTRPPGQGTGLGLAIVYSTVSKHAGSISVKSEPGHTRFSVQLPLTSQEHLQG